MSTHHQITSTHLVEMGSNTTFEDPTNGSYELFTLQGICSKPLTVKVRTSDQIDLQMEIDTGAAVSLISENTYKMQWSPPQSPAKTQGIYCDTAHLSMS